MAEEIIEAIEDDFQVSYEQILRIEPIENAEKLELAFVRGWQCVIPKDTYKVGDTCIYIPIDSILTDKLENLIFAGAKVKLNNHRVKSIKLRGALSQGLVVSPKLLATEYPEIWAYDDNLYKNRTSYVFVGSKHERMGLTEYLEVKKYEPPVKEIPSNMQGGPAKKKDSNQFFKIYEKFPNFKNAPHMMIEEDDVVITEKIHGTNWRAGWVPTIHNGFWSKMWVKISKYLPKRFKAPEYQFVYGSHRVQLNNKFLKSENEPDHKNPKILRKVNGGKRNVYAQTVIDYDMVNRIPKGMILYGEIYGDGVQKGYNYGLKQETDLILFDIISYTQLVPGLSKDDPFYITSGSYLNEIQYQYVLQNILNKGHDNAIKSVPILCKGKYSYDTANALRTGASVLCPEQKIREGIVIKTSGSPRKTVKFINDEYLLKVDTSDFH